MASEVGSTPFAEAESVTEALNFFEGVVVAVVEVVVVEVVVEVEKER